MEPGDFIITPGWTWHDHGNETDLPVIWLDGLDLALMQSLGPHFAEGYGEKRFPEGAPPGDSEARWGKMLRPVNTPRREALNSPVMRYPFAETRETLSQLRRTGEWDPFMGLKMEYTDPTTGGPAMPTLSTFIQLMPAGFKTERYRTTEATVYTAIEGSGTVTVWRTTGDGAGETMAMSFGPRDIFVIPCWHPHTFEIDDGADSVLFSFSDKVVQQKLGIWKEQRGNA
jgi:gentisate 1,2-dioxygenase